MSAVNEGDTKIPFAGGVKTARIAAFSRSERRNHHYNLSESHRNQFNNVNIRRLNQVPGSKRHHRARRSLDEGHFPAVSSPVKVRMSFTPEKYRETEGGHEKEGEPGEVRSEEGEKTQEDTGKTGGGAEECPLTHPDFGPVGEIDHFVGRCYCHLCTCQLHLCPNDFKKARFGQTIGSTVYREAYKPVQGGEPAKVINVQPAYAANTQPMDLMTTTQRDFQPFEVTSSPRSKPSTAPNSLKFTFRSSYQAEFPNWGSGDAVAEKRPHYPHRGNEVRMELRTTYGQSYRLPPVKTTETASKMNSTATSFSVSSEFYGETTSQKEYRSPNKHHFARLEPRPIEAPVLPESPGKVHFKTMYQTDFKGTQQAYRRPNRVSSVS